MKLLFLLISQIFFTSCKKINMYENVLDSRKLNENTSIFPALLLGFDQYRYSHNLIQFLVHSLIIDFWGIDYISFPISIKSNDRLRNLEEEVIYINCIKKQGIYNYYYGNIYYYNCSNSYYKFPSSIKFLN